jgi:hypothetical protein
VRAVNAFRMWQDTLYFTYDGEIDLAMYAWRIRWFEPENNPFR